MNYRTFFALEAALIHRLTKDWRRHSTPVISAIEKAIREKNWHAATQLVHDIDLSVIGEKNKEYIAYMMMSFATYGALTVNKNGPDFIKNGKHKQVIDNAATQVLVYLEHRATSQLQAKMLQLIAQAENDHHTSQLGSTTTKADDAGRYLTDLVSFGQDGDAALQLISSLQSSRLSTWGFLAEAQQKNQTQYMITAVLDGRTCEFCRMMDGKVFDVGPADDLINQALSATDPQDLAEIQPWPDQSKDALEEYAGMSNDGLADAKLSIPPWHPGDRCMLTMVEGGMPAASGVEEPEKPSDKEDFADVSPELSDDQLDYWNKFVDTLPNKALASMLGLTEEEVLGDELDAGAIQIDDGGEISFSGDIDVDGVTVNVDSILDPITGTVYLDQATFEAGDPAAAAEFLNKLFNGMLDQAESMNMSSLVVDSGAAAYEYAKMGFLPQPDDWQTMRMKLIDELQDGSLVDTYNALSDDEQATVLDLLSNQDEGALGALIDLPIDVEGTSLGQILLGDWQGQMSLDLTDPNVVSRAQQFL